MERRTVTIESKQGNIFTVQVEGAVVDRFIDTVTTKGGSWRNTKESLSKALESAVAVALSK